MKRIRAFTMVELLVVVVVVALMMALLLPSMTQARQVANDAVCKSNMHQISVALQTRPNDCSANDSPDPLNNNPWWILYVGNYLPDSYPASSTFNVQVNGGPSIKFNTGSDHTINGAYTYWPTLGVFRCPSVEEVHTYDVRNNYYYWGYDKTYSDYSYVGTHYKMNGWLTIPTTNMFNQQFGAGAFTYKMLNNEPTSSATGPGGPPDGLIVMFEAANVLPPSASHFTASYAPQNRHRIGADHFNYLLWSGEVKTMFLAQNEIYNGNSKMPYYNTHPWFSSVLK